MEIKMERKSKTELEKRDYVRMRGRTRETDLGSGRD